MAIRFKGPKAGENLGTVSATIGADTDSTTSSSFRLPTTATGLPRITGGLYAGDTFSLDAGGLTLTSYQWQEYLSEVWTNISGATSATFDTTGRGQVYVRCVTPEGTTPAQLVYTEMSNALMSREDQDIVNLVPQDEATHIADTNGSWTSAATWQNGAKPSNGARVFIPLGITVDYDESSTDIRLDSLRIDGELKFDHTADRRLKVYNRVITRGGLFECGTFASRVPQSITHTIEITNRHYQTEDRLPTDLDFSGSDPRLIGGGIINQGNRQMWGAEKRPWSRTRCVFELATTLNGATETSVELVGPLPSTFPTTGTIQVQTDTDLDDERPKPIYINYTNVSGTTLTIPSTDFSTDIATTGNVVYKSFAPMAGDESVTLAETPEGWAVGDEILIP